MMMIKLSKSLIYQSIPASGIVYDENNCQTGYNSFDFIVNCESRSYFIPVKDLVFSSPENQSNYYQFIAYSHYTYLENMTILAANFDYIIKIMTTDEDNNFEYYYINLRNEFPTVLAYEANFPSYTAKKLQAKKAGELLVILLWMNENATNIDHLFFLYIINYFPKEKKKIGILYKKVIKVIGLNDLFFFQNEYDGNLELFLQYQRHLALFKNSFQSFEFKFQKNITFTHNYNQTWQEIIFKESILVLKLANNYLQIYQYNHREKEFSKISEVFLDEAASVSSISLLKKQNNEILYYNSTETYMLFLDKTSQKLYIYLIFTFADAFMKSVCLKFHVEKNPIFKSMETLDFLPYYENLQHLRYILINPSMTENFSIALIPFCLENEYFEAYSCKRCNSSAFSLDFQGSSCSGDVLQIEKTPEKLMLFNYFSLVHGSLNSLSTGENNHGFCSEKMEKFISPTFDFSNKFMWNINNNGVCELVCSEQNLYLSGNDCVKSTEMLIYHDVCRQFTDCYNCSATFDCIWHSNACQKYGKQFEIDDDFKRTDILWKFERCEKLDICGRDSVFVQSEGVIRLNNSNENNIIPKNSLCMWEIFTVRKSETSQFMYYDLFLDINFANFAKMRDFSPRLHFCLFVPGTPNCMTWPHLINFSNFSQMYRVFSSKFIVSLYFPEETQENLENMSIKFQKSEELFLDFTSFLTDWVIISLVSLICMLCCLFLLKSLAFSLRRDRSVPLLRRLEFELYNFETPKHRLKRLIEEKLILRMYYNALENSFNQEECPFCLDKFSYGDDIAKFICQHIFHFNCLEQWNKVERKNVLQCPLCKEELIKKAEGEARSSESEQQTSENIEP